MKLYQLELRSFCTEVESICPTSPKENNRCLTRVKNPIKAQALSALIQTEKISLNRAEPG